MKKVVYFSLFIPTIDNSNYCSMLYHALETLEPFYKNQYDVVVMYSIPGVDLNEYLHLDDFNLIKDFPWVKFIQSDYHHTHSDIYMHKWYNLKKVFDLNYDTVFYLDCDIIFNQDPNFIFDKYNNNAAWMLLEGNDTPVCKFLGYPGAPSGQLVIHRTAFAKCKNLYEKILLKQQELVSRAYSEMSTIEAGWFKNLSEQYAAQAAIIDCGVEIRALSVDDVCFGINAFAIKFIDGIMDVTIGPSVITHYFGKNDYIFVPDKLKTTSMYEKISKINPDTFFNTIY